MPGAAAQHSPPAALWLADRGERGARAGKTARGTRRTARTTRDPALLQGHSQECYLPKHRASRTRAAPLLSRRSAFLGLHSRVTYGWDCTRRPYKPQKD